MSLPFSKIPCSHRDFVPCASRYFFSSRSAASQQYSFTNTMARNATTAGALGNLHGQDTYWAQFDSISASHISLNYFERLWLAWYTYMQNDVLATGIMSFVTHEAIYFGRSLPWVIVDMIPYFRQWKIQNVRCVFAGGKEQSLIE